MADDSTEMLADLPPSGKLVYYVLRQDGAMTQKALADETMLPRRTARYAINRLEDIDVVTKRINVMDARKSIYELREEGGNSETPHGSSMAADD